MKMIKNSFNDQSRRKLNSGQEDGLGGRRHKNSMKMMELEGGQDSVIALTQYSKL